VEEMSKPALSIQNLGYTYPKAEKPLFSGLNLEVEAGQSFGLFGPNGAGKTTLISLITNVLKYSTGSITFFGQELSQNRKSILPQIGYVPQSLSLYEELTPIQNLRYFGVMMGLSKAVANQKGAEILHVLGLDKVQNKPIKQFSGGMKRRVNLAIGVIHEPKFLFLDEPTVGVDIQTRHAIIDYLKALNEKGTTLFYTSHHLAEAQELCREIALIDNGELLVKDQLDKILLEHNQDSLEAVFIEMTGSEYRD
jgi:ABC-2 type transport system ATP-binding protein